MMLLASFGTVMITIGIVTVSILMIGLILLQKNRGAGLSGAFGGVGGYSAFGTKTGDFLTWVTCGLVALFLLLNIAGTYVFEPTKISPPGSSPVSGQMPQTPGGAPTGQAPGQPIQVQVPPSGTAGQPISIEVPAQSPGKAQPIAIPFQPAAQQPAPTTQPS